MSEPCELCHSVDWQTLPDPHTSRSIFSDFRVIESPLAKQSCRRCGMVRRASEASGQEIFDAYNLYAHEPGGPFESARQAQYASWLASTIDAPASVFEAGAGNGSLQLALKRHWPQAQTWGLEPAVEAAAFARAAGLAVAGGYLGPRSGSEPSAQMALAVNVLEHVPHAESFLRDLGSHSSQRLAVIVPNGALANGELLFADHLRSLTPEHLRRLFVRIGFGVIHQSKAPVEIGDFFLTVGSMAAFASKEPTEDARQIESLHAQRAAYISAWSDLDVALRNRIGQRRVICFGTGEAAALLRAYAPSAWNAVEAYTDDRRIPGSHGILSVHAYDSLHPTTLLVGVRIEVQATVAKRLLADGHDVIRWDDLLPR